MTLSLVRTSTSTVRDMERPNLEAQQRHYITCIQAIKFQLKLQFENNQP